MGWFSKKKSFEEEHLTVADEEDGSPAADVDPRHISPKFRRLLTRHAGMGMDKRATLNDMLGEEFPWQFETETGKLTLAKTHVYRAYVLGTASAISNTWLWAWANQQSEIPESVLKAAASLRQFGQKENIPELTEPKIPLDRVSLLHLALVGCGLCKADLFYLGPTDHGALLLLAVAPELRERAVSHTVRTSGVVTNIAAQLGPAVDHRECIVSYLKDKGYALQDDGTTLRATAPTGDPLTVTFDAQGRLKQVQLEASDVSR